MTYKELFQTLRELFKSELAKTRPKLVLVIDLVKSDLGNYTDKVIFATCTHNMCEVVININISETGNYTTKIDFDKEIEFTETGLVRVSINSPDGKTDSALYLINPLDLNQITLSYLLKKKLMQ